MTLSRNSNDCENCAKALQRSVLLKYCTDSQLKSLCSHAAVKKKFKKGEILQKEGFPQTHMYVIVEGSVVREKMDEHGKLHQIDTFLGGHSIGSLHVMNKDPAYATARCVTDVVAYVIPSEDLVKHFKSDPDFAYNVAYSLMMEVRRWTKTQRTPLLEQPAKRTPFLAVSVAAGIESFYRAALNAFLNQQLTGKQMGSLFPNMHVQVPTRIAYINGFKGIRQLLDEKLEKMEEPTTTVRLLAAITPGICMSPLSSILEASNAGGSLSAGIISGYLSHIVHNLSTLKLMDPSKSYAVHMKEYIERSERRVPAFISNGFFRKFTTTTLAMLAPTGVLLRTTQIVGSFIILNGTISAINRAFYQKPPVVIPPPPPPTDVVQSKEGK